MKPGNIPKKPNFRREPRFQLGPNEGFVEIVHGSRSIRGSLIDISSMLANVWTSLFGIEAPMDVPVWAAWLSLLTFCGACMMLLARKVRAYEIVKS